MTPKYDLWAEKTDFSKSWYSRVEFLRFEPSKGFGREEISNPMSRSWRRPEGWMCRCAHHYNDRLGLGLLLGDRCALLKRKHCMLKKRFLGTRTEGVKMANLEGCQIWGESNGPKGIRRCQRSWRAWAGRRSNIYSTGSGPMKQGATAKRLKDAREPREPAELGETVWGTNE